MDQAQKDNAAHLAEMIIAKGEPHKDSETRILRLSGRSMGTSSEEFRELLSEMTAKVTQSHDQVVIDGHRKCLNLILNTLALCIFRFEWVSLPLNGSNFEEGEYLNWLGFSRRRMKSCIDILEGHDLMILGRKGHRGGEEAQAKASQYYPSERFIRMMCSCLYTEFGDFDDNADESLYQFRLFNDQDLPIYGSYNYKIETLRRYNTYMREHSWAMKNPSHIGVKDFDGRSGRVVNYYQNLAERRVQIRTNTLLDGEKIAEPDFSANHLRMASHLVGEELPDDPYTVVAVETGLTRDQVKSIVTKCMGASSLRSKGGIIRDSRLARIAIDKYEFRAGLESLEQNYPWTNDIFFHDFGTRLQYLEGRIALHMMDWAVTEDVPLLVVHDAYAVKESDEERTYDHMQHAWKMTILEAQEDRFLEKTKDTVPRVIARKALIKKAKEAKKAK